MDVAKELALLCVISTVKQAADPRAVRDEFETSANREKLQRRQAGRLGELAQTRAEDEDTSLGGYANTAAARMLPVPQTPTEAAVRLPMVGAGGALGYSLGKKLESPDPESVKQLFTASGGAGGKKKGGGSPMKKVVESVGSVGGKKKPSIDKGFNQLSLESPEALHEAFGGQKRMPTFEEIKQRIGGFGSVRSFDDLKQRAGDLVHMPDAPMGRDGTRISNIAKQRFGKNAPGQLTQEVRNLLAQNKDIPSGSKWPRRLGMLGGIGAASLATGIPLAARALWNKQYGGDAAVRARGEAADITSSADSEAAKRESLIQSLGSGLPKLSSLLKR